MEKKKLMITSFQLKILRLKAQGFSTYKIAKQLGISDDKIIRTSLVAVKKNFPELEKAVVEVIEGGYMECLDTRFDAQSAAAKGREDYRKDLRWVGRPPFGYRKGEDDRLKVYSPEAKIVRRLFEGIVVEKKTARQLSEETGLYPSKIINILRKTCHKGMTNFRGVLMKTHDAIVDPELWDKAQPAGKRTYGVAPFGYRNLAGRVETCEPEAEKVRRVFDLRLNTDKSMPQIARECELSFTSIDHILKNWRYTGHSRVRGRLVKCGYPRLIDLKDFVAIRHKRRVKWEKAVKRQVKRGIETREKIIACFPAKAREIEEKTGFKRGTIDSWLRRLRREGWIEKLTDGRFTERVRTKSAT